MPRYSLSDSLSLQWDRGRRRRKKETGSEAGMEEKRRVSLAEDREIEDALYSVRCYQPRYWYFPFHCTKDSQRGRILDRGWLEVRGTPARSIWEGRYLPDGVTRVHAVPVQAGRGGRYPLDRRDPRVHSPHAPSLF